MPFKSCIELDKLTGPNLMVAALEVKTAPSGQVFCLELPRNQLVNGGGDEIRSRDLVRDEQHSQGHLIDYAARLATLNYTKARSGHSSWTDSGLVHTLQATQIMGMCCKKSGMVCYG